MPSQPVKPLGIPVKLGFPDGTQLTSLFDPVTNQHSVHCDLCGKLNQLGLRGAGNSIYQHRNSEGCRFHALKVCWKWSRLKKFKKERDQTQFPQLFLTAMTQKTSNIFYTRVNNFLDLYIGENVKFYVIFQLQPNCGNKFPREHSHISHDPSGYLIWLQCLPPGPNQASQHVQIVTCSAFLAILQPTANAQPSTSVISPAGAVKVP